MTKQRPQCLRLFLGTRENSFLPQREETEKTLRIPKGVSLVSVSLVGNHERSGPKKNHAAHGRRFAHYTSTAGKRATTHQCVAHSRGRVCLFVY